MDKKMKSEVKDKLFAQVDMLEDREKTSIYYSIGNTDIRIYKINKDGKTKTLAYIDKSTGEIIKKKVRYNYNKLYN